MLDNITIIIPAKNKHFMSYEGYTGISEEQLPCVLENPECNHNIMSIKKNCRRIIAGAYFPEVSLFLIGEPKFYITFSAPRLYFGNNLYELENSDLDGVIRELRSKLNLMGISITAEEILNANIHKMEVSKNIVLNKISCTKFLSTLDKMKFYSKLKAQKTEFRDEYKTKKKFQPGTMFSLYSKKHQLNFYNKNPEIKKNQWGTDFLNKTEFADKQVLRIEYRIPERKYIKDILEKYNLSQKTTFKDVFDTQFCRDLLTAVWDKIVSKRIEQLNLINCDTDMLTDVYFNKQKQARTILCTLGVSHLIGKGYSLDEIIAPFPNNSNTLQQILQTVEQCSEFKKTNKKATNPLVLAFNRVRRDLESYNLIRPPKPAGMI